MSIRAISQSIQGAWGAHWDQIRQASRNRRLLLVEGDDDKAVVEELLRTRDPVWERAVYVAAAGDRDKVLNKLGRHPEIFGLVDRDVWDVGETAARVATSPNLLVTSGWCMENHFCDPNTLEAAFALPAGAIQASLAGVVAGWLSHGAIWWTLQRLRHRIGSAFPPVDFGHPDKDPCDAGGDAQVLRRRLDTYEALVKTSGTDSVVQAIRDRHREVMALPDPAKIEQGIHGKRFFVEAVAPMLGRLKGQNDAGQWRNLAARAWSGRWPTYLVRFAERLLA